MDQEELINRLASFDILAEVPRDQIMWMVERGNVGKAKAGELVFKRGDAIDKMTALLEGAVSLRIELNGNYRELGRIEKGEISGALPYSRAQSATGHAMSIIDTTYFSLHKDHFRDLVCECHELTAALVHLMTDRVRDFSRFQHQNEKLMALGKLSAGLAHELNNPAAAIVRSAESLQCHLGSVPEKFKRVISMEVNDEQIDFVNDLVFGKLEKGINKSESLLKKTEREDDLTDWLDENGYGDCYMLSETLADYGFSDSDLVAIKEKIGNKEFPAVLEWVDNVLTTEKMVGEIREASNRISTLVNSVKSYSHMDRSSDFEPTDLHEGLRTTLSILNHKVRANKVKVQENWGDGLSKVEAISGQLNQVWTNLIDNALDAMEESGGELSITTQQSNDEVRVRIADTGKGIPEEIRGKIFDPFFTTKAVGKGTGLGLETVQSIIENHQGSIQVESEPGSTIFQVNLPLKQG